jgi:nucleotide-binding universal stress UspA family protein
MIEIRRILVAVDFSEHTEAAVEVARDFAQKSGAELHVVHAFELASLLVSPYQVAVPDLYLVENRNAVGRRLEELVERLRDSGITAHPHLTEAPAAPAIARLAEEIGADLIVMGTRGTTGLEHLLLGSVAERTLRLAPCSVLTVKVPEDS